MGERCVRSCVAIENQASGGDGRFEKFVKNEHTRHQIPILIQLPIDNAAAAPFWSITLSTLAGSLPSKTRRTVGSTTVSQRIPIERPLPFATSCERQFTIPPEVFFDDGQKWPIISFFEETQVRILSQSVFPDLNIVRDRKKPRDLSNNLLAQRIE